MSLWNRLFGKKKESRFSCVLEETSNMLVPKSYFGQGKPLVILEMTHYHIISQDGIMDVNYTVGGFQYPPAGKSLPLDKMPHGVYTLESFCTLSEFKISNEDKSNRDSGTVS